MGNKDFLVRYNLIRDEFYLIPYTLFSPILHHWQQTSIACLVGAHAHACSAHILSLGSHQDSHSIRCGVHVHSVYKTHMGSSLEL